MTNNIFTKYQQFNKGVKLDKRKKYYLVLDTETAGEIEKPLVYDFGYCIVDKKGKIYKEYNVIIQETFDDIPLMEKSYFASKLPDYVHKITTGQLDKVKWATAIMQMLEDIITYNATVLCAYNLGFDMRALNNTNLKYRGKTMDEIFNSMELLDIWTLATQTIMTRKNYIPFCVENGYYTKAKNIQTSAEVCYKFMKNDTDFIEDHTALSDVKIEVEIMAQCFRMKKKIASKFMTQPFRIVNHKDNYKERIEMIAKREKQG